MIVLRPTHPSPISHRRHYSGSPNGSCACAFRCGRPRPLADSWETMEVSNGSFATEFGQPQMSAMLIMLTGLINLYSPQFPYFPKKNQVRTTGHIPTPRCVGESSISSRVEFAPPRLSRRRYCRPPLAEPPTAGCFTKRTGLRRLLTWLGLHRLPTSTASTFGTRSKIPTVPHHTAPKCSSQTTFCARAGKGT